MIGMPVRIDERQSSDRKLEGADCRISGQGSKVEPGGVVCFGEDGLKSVIR